LKQAFGIQEDACQIMAENEKKLKSQLAPPNKETTFIDNLYSDGEIAKTNPINDIEKVVNPKSRTMEKSVIHDDSKFNEEKAKGIEEMAKIKLLDTATDSMCSKLTNFFITFKSDLFSLSRLNSK